MGKIDEDGQEALKDELTSGGALLIPNTSDLDKRADQFEADLIRVMQESGTITPADAFFTQLARDTWKIYTGMTEKINGLYTEQGRFGEDKPHHLLAELRATRRDLLKLLSDAGLTPESRHKLGFNIQPGSGHGNSHSAQTLDIINGA
jgi:phage terminase small subunit